MKAFVASLATLGLVVLSACGSSSPVEVVVEPGITAIEQSSALACDADLESLLLAVEAYTILNVGPPAAESDLVPDWLRSESALYDLAGGQIVPAPGSGCAAAPADPAVAAPGTTVDPVLVRACSIRFKTMRVAIEAYYAMNGPSVVPTEQALVDAGLVRGLDDALDIDALGQIVAVPGGVCDGVEVVPTTGPPGPTGPGPLPATVRECERQLKVFEISMEAYWAQNGVRALAESDLVPKLMGREASGYDLVDGEIVPAPGSICR
jgi:hypothetical protein